MLGAIDIAKIDDHNIIIIMDHSMASGWTFSMDEGSYVARTAGGP